MCLPVGMIRRHVYLGSFCPAGIKEFVAKSLNESSVIVTHPKT